MSPVFDLYAVRYPSIEAARSSVEQALDLELVPRESSYLGEYFGADGMDGEHLTLQSNFHVGEQDWIEPDHSDVPFLLYVNNALSPDTTRTRLERDPQIRRLRHTEL